MASTSCALTLPDKGGYLLLNAIQEPVEAGFQAEPGIGKPYVAYMSGYKNTIRLISLLPTSIGYNPSETVYALASYISDRIIKAHG